MILTGDEIHKNLGSSIEIDPFSEDRLQPNGYDLTLHDEVMIYEEVVLDMKKPNRVRRRTIPNDGIVLTPNQLYLARTVEKITAHDLVPMVEGRSSVGRLGLFVNVASGFGDAGFSGHWTLTMFAIQPIRIYAGIPICKMMFHRVEGEVQPYASGKYQNNVDIQPSLLHRELDPNSEAEDAQMSLPFELAKIGRVS